MKHKIDILIEAPTEAEARQIAQAMSAASGLFKALEWTKMSSLLKNPLVHLKIKSMLK